MPRRKRKASVPKWAKKSTTSQLKFGVQFGGGVVSRIAKRELKNRKAKVPKRKFPRR